MATNLFSTYSTGENRVTASIIAVLRSVTLDRIQRLLRALIEDKEFELIRFQNQLSKGGSGAPDAVIQSSCRLLVETKIKLNAVRDDQLKRHLKRLDEATETNRLLLVLTPDDSQPSALDTINDERLVWARFTDFHQAIDDMLSEKSEVVSEREAFLLRELQEMFVAENLVASEYDVVVVPARFAWPEYEEHHAYVCQADRAFQQVSRIAFYAHGCIQPLVPLILESHDHVEFTECKHKGRLGELVSANLKAKKRTEGTAYKVLLLSAPDSPDTMKLDRPIPNDLVAKSGRPTAFTQNQRYVSSGRLRTATTTSDLVDGKT